MNISKFLFVGHLVWNVAFPFFYSTPILYTNTIGVPASLTGYGPEL